MTFVSESNDTYNSHMCTVHAVKRRFISTCIHTLGENIVVLYKLSNEIFILKIRNILCVNLRKKIFSLYCMSDL